MNWYQEERRRRLEFADVRRLEAARLAVQEHQERATASRLHGREFSKEIVRTLVVLNGGAIIALLTFVGNQAGTSSGIAHFGNIQVAISMFVIGLLTAMVGGLLVWNAYVATSNTETRLLHVIREVRLRGRPRRHVEYENVDLILHVLAVMFLIGSLLLFVGGSFVGLHAFQG